jgi:hypothetical protein
VAAIVGALVVVIAVVVGLGSRFTMVQSLGNPSGASFRTKQWVATLITTVEPYPVSLNQSTQPKTQRVDLLLHPLDGGSPKPLIRIAEHQSASAFQLGSGILGEDGNLLWILTQHLYAYDFQSGRVITEQELSRLNPGLNELLSNGLIRFDGRLRISTRDDRQAMELDPVTLKARPSSQPTRPGGLPSSIQVDSFLFAGTLLSKTNWFGVCSTNDLQRYFKPGSFVSGVMSTDTSRQVRRLYQAHLDATLATPRASSMVLLSSEEYLDAALIRTGPRGEPLRFHNPEGFLMVYRSQSGFQGTWVLARVELSGEFRWKVDTGIADLEQILPGTDSIALGGRLSRVPDKVQEPVLAILDCGTGKIAVHSLVQGRKEGKAL